MAIDVVIEHIIETELAGRESDAGDVHFAANLILVIVEPFGLTAEAESLPEKKTGEVGSRRSDRRPGKSRRW